jgi:hypothetical protein
MVNAKRCSHRMRPLVRVCGLWPVRTPRMPGGGTPLPNEGRISEGYSEMTLDEPATRPANPRFSSGPCAKPPFIRSTSCPTRRLAVAPRRVGKAKLKAAIETTRAILGVPADYRSASSRPPTPAPSKWPCGRCWARARCTMVAWESFGAGWVTDVVKQLKLDARSRPPSTARSSIWRGRFRHRRGLHLERHDSAACACRTAMRSRRTARA